MKVTTSGFRETSTSIIFASRQMSKSVATKNYRKRFPYFKWIWPGFGRNSYHESAKFSYLYLRNNPEVNVGVKDLNAFLQDEFYSNRSFTSLY